MMVFCLLVRLKRMIYTDKLPSDMCAERARHEMHVSRRHRQNGKIPLSRYYWESARRWRVQRDTYLRIERRDGYTTDPAPEEVA